MSLSGGDYGASPAQNAGLHCRIPVRSRAALTIGIAFLVCFLMGHTTFAFSDVLRAGGTCKNFPEREAFAITNDPNACLRNHVGIRVTTPLLGWF
jgi:hypothetical protein